MKIFDCHTHIEDGLDKYDLSGVSSHNIIFNSVSSYKANRTKTPAGCSISLIFDCFNNLDFVLNELRSKKINALKIHSREQHISENMYPVIEEKLLFTDDSVPVIIDAFYYGHELKYQPSLPAIINLAVKYPNRSFIIAHCGGYEIVKYFLVRLIAWLLLILARVFRHRMVLR